MTDADRKLIEALRDWHAERAGNEVWTRRARDTAAANAAALTTLIDDAALVTKLRDALRAMYDGEPNAAAQARACLAAEEPRTAQDTRRDCTCTGSWCGVKAGERIGKNWRCVMGRENPAEEPRT